MIMLMMIMILTMMTMLLMLTSCLLLCHLQPIDRSHTSVTRVQTGSAQDSNYEPRYNTFPWLLSSIIARCPYRAQFRSRTSTIPNMQLGSTVARQKQIQDFLKPRSKFTHRNAIPPRYITVIYEFCLARQKHDV